MRRECQIDVGGKDCGKLAVDFIPAFQNLLKGFDEQNKLWLCAEHYDMYVYSSGLPTHKP